MTERGRKDPRRCDSWQGRRDSNQSYNRPTLLENGRVLSPYDTDMFGDLNADDIRTEIHVTIKSDMRHAIGTPADARPMNNIWSNRKRERSQSPEKEGLTGRKVMKRDRSKSPRCQGKESRKNHRSVNVQSHSCQMSYSTPEVKNGFKTNRSPQNDRSRHEGIENKTRESITHSASAERYQEVVFGQCFQTTRVVDGYQRVRSVEVRQQNESDDRYQRVGYVEGYQTEMFNETRQRSESFGRFQRNGFVEDYPSERFVETRQRNNYCGRFQQDGSVEQYEKSFERLQWDESTANCNRNVSCERYHRKRPVDRSNKNWFCKSFSRDRSADRSLRNDSCEHYYRGISVDRKYRNGSGERYHGNMSLDNSHRNESGECYIWERSVDRKHRNGSGERYHGDMSVDRIQRSGSGERYHRNMPVDQSHRNSGGESYHRERSVDRKYRNGSVERYHGNMSLDNSHRNESGECYSWERSVDRKHRNGSGERYHGDMPVDRSHRSGSGECYYWDMPVDRSHRSGSDEHYYGDMPVDRSHRSGSGESFYQERSVDREERSGSGERHLGDMPVDRSYRSGSGKHYHGDTPVDRSHRSGSGESFDQERSVDREERSGSGVRYHGDMPVDRSHRSGSGKRYHRDTPVDQSHRNGCGESYHRERSVDRKYRKGSGERHLGDMPINRSHRSGSGVRYHGDMPVDRSHRSGSVERYHWEMPGDRSHRSGSGESFYQERSVDRKERSGSGERYHWDKPVDRSHRSGYGDSFDQERSVDRKERSGSGERYHGDMPVDRCHRSGSVERYHRERSVDRSHRKSPGERQQWGSFLRHDSRQESKVFFRNCLPEYYETYCKNSGKPSDHYGQFGVVATGQSKMDISSRRQHTNDLLLHESVRNTGASHRDPQCRDCATNSCRNGTLRNDVSVSAVQSPQSSFGYTPKFNNSGGSLSSNMSTISSLKDFSDCNYITATPNKNLQDAYQRTRQPIQVSQESDNRPHLQPIAIDPATPLAGQADVVAEVMHCLVDTAQHGTPHGMQHGTPHGTQQDTPHGMQHGNPFGTQHDTSNGTRHSVLHGTFHVTVDSLFDVVTNRAHIPLNTLTLFKEFIQQNREYFRQDLKNGIEYIGPATDIRICSNYVKKEKGPNSTCNNACGRLHICLFSLFGTCRKPRCEKDHNLFSEHNENVLRSHRLHRIPPVSIRHVISDPSNRNMTTLPVICRFYNNERKCKKNEKCPHLHVCKYFVEDTCKFESKCMRAHSFTSPQTAIVLQKFGLTHDQDVTMLRQLMLKSVQPKNNQRYFSSGVRTANINRSDSKQSATALNSEEALHLSREDTCEKTEQKSFEFLSLCTGTSSDKSAQEVSKYFNREKSPNSLARSSPSFVFIQSRGEKILSALADTVESVDSNSLKENRHSVNTGMHQEANDKGHNISKETRTDRELTNNDVEKVGGPDKDSKSWQLDGENEEKHPSTDTTPV